jgi:hypothetical protein
MATERCYPRAIDPIDEEHDRLIRERKEMEGDEKVTDIRQISPRYLGNN